MKARPPRPSSPRSRPGRPGTGTSRTLTGSSQAAVISQGERTPCPGRSAARGGRPACRRPPGAADRLDFRPFLGERLFKRLFQPSRFRSWGDLGNILQVLPVDAAPGDARSVLQTSISPFPAGSRPRKRFSSEARPRLHLLRSTLRPPRITSTISSEASKSAPEGSVRTRRRPWPWSSSNPGFASV